MHVTLIKAFLYVCSVARLVTGTAGVRQAKYPELSTGPQVAMLVGLLLGKDRGGHWAVGGAAGGTCPGVGFSGLECEPASKTEVCSSISYLTGLRRAVQGGHEAHVTGSSFCHLHEPHTEHAGSWPEGCGSLRLEHDCWCPPCRCCSHRSLDGPQQCVCLISRVVFSLQLTCVL